MNIDQMAHEHAIEFLKAAFEEDKDCSINYQLLAEESYLYADAMQAESDKRKPKGLPEVLQDEFNIDWSQAPDNAIAWKMNKYKYCMWLQEHNNPAQSLIWLCDAPSFNYQGDWKDSLRKRP